MSAECIVVMRKWRCSAVHSVALFLYTEHFFSRDAEPLMRERDFLVSRLFGVPEL